MDKTRTIYKFRKFKNGTLFSMLILTLGIGIFCSINIFETKIISAIQKNVIKLSLEQGIEDTQVDTTDICYKIFSLFEKSSLFSILFALESFIMILFFIRMSSKTPKFAKSAPTILSLGTLLLLIYYIITAFSTITEGIFSDLAYNQYFFLKIIGISLIFMANISFIRQIFNQIVLEKEFY